MLRGVLFGVLLRAAGTNAQEFVAKVNGHFEVEPVRGTRRLEDDITRVAPHTLKPFE